MKISRLLECETDSNDLYLIVLLDPILTMTENTIWRMSWAERGRQWAFVRQGEYFAIRKKSNKGNFSFKKGFKVNKNIPAKTLISI